MAGSIPGRSSALVIARIRHLKISFMHVSDDLVPLEHGPGRSFASTM
jgi:hypothetical protein